MSTPRCRTCAGMGYVVEVGYSYTDSRKRCEGCGGTGESMAVQLYARFDEIHARHGLAEVACGGTLSPEAAQRALADLLPLVNDALTALARHDRVNPFDLSLIPALHASLVNPKSDISRARAAPTSA